MNMKVALSATTLALTLTQTSSALAQYVVQIPVDSLLNGRSVPDDGLFPATGMLPPFQLHFSNAAPATSPQTYYIHAKAAQPSFQFSVPPAVYSALYLIFTCSEGSATFTVTLSYAGGVASNREASPLETNSRGARGLSLMT